MEVDLPWLDCKRLRPYRDHRGKWAWGGYVQRRPIIRYGWFSREPYWGFEYREREETREEWDTRQW